MPFWENTKKNFLFSLLKFLSFFKFWHPEVASGERSRQRFASFTPKKHTRLPFPTIQNENEKNTFFALFKNDRNRLETEKPKICYRVPETEKNRRKTSGKESSWWSSIVRKFTWVSGNIQQLPTPIAFLSVVHFFRLSLEPFSVWFFLFWLFLRSEKRWKVFVNCL